MDKREKSDKRKHECKILLSMESSVQTDRKSPQ